MALGVIVFSRVARAERAMTSPRSLYADWSARRAALAAQDKSDTASRTVAKVLDFLLRRYRDAPESGEPVHTLSRRELCVNEWAIVVHAHLGHSAGRIVQSSGAAARRVQGVLERMHAPPETGWTESLAGRRVELSARRREQRLRLLLGDCTERMEGFWFIQLARDLHDVGLMCDLLEVPMPADEAPDERATMLWLLELLSGVESAERGSLYLDWRMRHAQLLGSWQAWPEVPEVHVLLGKLLFRYRGSPEARQPAMAPRRTAGGAPDRHDIIQAYTARPVKPLAVGQSSEAWRGSLADQGLTVALADERHYWAHHARMQLLAPAESDRVGALAMLADVGDLHDVGLMCDLLALTEEEQNPWERAAMLVVLRSRASAIAGTQPAK